MKTSKYIWVLCGLLANLSFASESVTEFVDLWTKNSTAHTTGWINSDGTYGGCGTRRACREKVDHILDLKLAAAEEKCEDQGGEPSSRIGTLHEEISSTGKHWEYTSTARTLCEKFVKPIPNSEE